MKSLPPGWEVDSSAAPVKPKGGVSLPPGWEVEKEPPPAKSMGTGEIARRGFVQGGTMDFGDELAGAVQGGLQGLANAAPEGSLRWAGIENYKGGEEDVGKVYTQGRDDDRKLNAAAQKQDPLTYGVSSVAGSIAGPGKFMKVGSGLKGALGTGALIGGATATGASEADNVKDLAAHAAIGAGGGAVISGGLYGVGKGVRGVANYFGKKGAEATDEVVEGFAAKQRPALERAAKAEEKLAAKPQVRSPAPPGKELTDSEIARKVAGKRGKEHDIIQQRVIRLGQLEEQAEKLRGIDPAGHKRALSEIQGYREKVNQALQGPRPTEIAEKYGEGLRAGRSPQGKAAGRAGGDVGGLAAKRKEAEDVLARAMAHREDVNKMGGLKNLARANDIVAGAQRMDDRAANDLLGAKGRMAGMKAPPTTIEPATASMIGKRGPQITADSPQVQQALRKAKGDFGGKIARRAAEGAAFGGLGVGPAGILPGVAAGATGGVFEELVRSPAARANIFPKIQRALMTDPEIVSRWGAMLRGEPSAALATQLYAISKRDPRVKAKLEELDLRADAD